LVSACGCGDFKNRTVFPDAGNPVIYALELADEIIYGLSQEVLSGKTGTGPGLDEPLGSVV
jgi:hypothetical protein